MAQSFEELPARALCAGPHHLGPRWLRSVYFGHRWVKRKRKDGGHNFYLYLKSYCEACVRMQSRVIHHGDITVTRPHKLYIEGEQRAEYDRQYAKKWRKRHMMSPWYRKKLNESRRMSRQAKRELKASAAGWEDD